MQNTSGGPGVANCGLLDWPAGGVQPPAGGLLPSRGPCTALRPRQSSDSRSRPLSGRYRSFLALNLFIYRL